MSQSHGTASYRCPSYSRAVVGADACKEPTSTAAEALEDHVVSAFLSDFGTVPEVRMVEHPHGDDYAEERNDSSPPSMISTFNGSRPDASTQRVAPSGTE